MSAPQGFADGTNLLIGRGKAYFDRFDAAGNHTGFRFLGELNKVDTTVTVQSKERYTTGRAESLKIANVVTQQKHEISVELMEVTRKNVALALLGTDAAVTQAAATVTGEVIAGGVGQPAPGVGRSYQTSKTGLTAIALTATATGGAVTALVAGVDYQIEDASAGLITLLSALAGSAATITATSYSAAAVNGSKVSAGTTANIRGALLFVGDPASGPKVILRVWNAQLTPSGALSLLSDDFASFTLGLEVLVDLANHPDAPLYELFYPSLPAGGTAVTPPPGTPTAVVFADANAGTRFSLAIAQGSETWTPVDSSIGLSAPLILIDTATGDHVSVGITDGALAWTVVSSSIAGVASFQIADTFDGTLFNLAITNGAFTWTPA